MVMFTFSVKKYVCLANWQFVLQKTLKLLSQEELFLLKMHQKRLVSWHAGVA